MDFKTSNLDPTFMTSIWKGRGVNKNDCSLWMAVEWSGKGRDGPQHENIDIHILSPVVYNKRYLVHIVATPLLISEICYWLSDFY